MTIRCLAILLVTYVSIDSGVAQDVSSKSEQEPFPQSAKLARDRRAELVLETAKAQLRQKDYATALAALQ